MKATISNCLLEMIDLRFGKEQSAAAVERAGLSLQSTTLRLPIVDIADEHFGRLFHGAMSVTGLGAEALCDAFGEHWCCVYAPKMYPAFLAKFSNAKDMIVGLDGLHVGVTRSVPNARPPRFKTTWLDGRTLDVEYVSERKLIDVYVGLARGVGKYFKEPMQVTKQSETRVTIVFGA